MLDCWQENPDARPLFASLKKALKEMERNQVVNDIIVLHKNNMLKDHGKNSLIS